MKNSFFVPTVVAGIAILAVCPTASHAQWVKTSSMVMATPEQVTGAGYYSSEAVHAPSSLTTFPPAQGYQSYATGGSSITATLQVVYTWASPDGAPANTPYDIAVDFESKGQVSITGAAISQSSSSNKDSSGNAYAPTPGLPYDDRHTVPQTGKTPSKGDLVVTLTFSDTLSASSGGSIYRSGSQPTFHASADSIEVWPSQSN